VVQDPAGILLFNYGKGLRCFNQRCPGCPADISADATAHTAAHTATYTTSYAATHTASHASSPFRPS